MGRDINRGQKGGENFRKERRARNTREKNIVGCFRELCCRGRYFDKLLNERSR